MAATAFSNVVTDITNQSYIPSMVDSVSTSNVVLARALGAQRTRTWSGSVVKQPIQYAQATNGGSFSGLDTFDLTQQNVTDVLSWYPTAYYQSIVVAGLEKAVNQTDAQVLGLMKTVMDQARIGMSESLGSIFYGLGVGKDFDGLQLIVDDATLTSSYGGLTRSSRPQINAGYNVAASGGLLTLDYLASLIDGASAASSVQESPNLLLTTKAVFSFYEALNTPTVSNNYQQTEMAVSANTAVGVAVPKSSMQANEAKNGFRALSWRGVPVVADDKAPTGIIYALNENYLEFDVLRSSDLQSISMQTTSTDGIYSEIANKSAFQLKPTQTAPNAWGEFGQIILAGQYICRQPRRNGKLTGITGV